MFIPYTYLTYIRSPTCQNAWHDLMYLLGVQSSKASHPNSIMMHFVSYVSYPSDTL